MDRIRPNRTKVDRTDQIGLKWAAYDQSGQNVPNRTNVDRSGLSKTEWTKVDQIELWWTEWTK